MTTRLPRVERLGDLRVMVKSEIGAEPAVRADDASGSAAATDADVPRSQIEADNVAAGNVATGKVGEEPVYPRWPWSWPVRMFRIAFVELVMRPLIWMLAAPRVRCETTALPGPVLVIANHVTAYDGALVLYALPWKTSAADGDCDVGRDADGSPEGTKPGERAGRIWLPRQGTGWWWRYSTCFLCRGGADFAGALPMRVRQWIKATR